MQLEILVADDWESRVLFWQEQRGRAVKIPR